MNSIKITGNVTKDPEIRALGNSNWSALEFSIGNNDESKKNSEGQYENIASFFDIKHLFDNTKEYNGIGSTQYWIQKISKGSSVTIQGRLKQERWEKDGKKHSRVKIVAKTGWGEGRPIVVHPKVQKEQGQGSAPTQFDEDGIPF